ncbi:MAG: HIT domain-containing protein, partial [Clostridiales bacterium]|nr:HIT domain-containing protein [Clostridiales bacterium]
MDNCVFCKIANGEIPTNKIYDDGLFVAFMDMSPLTPGHCLVIPKTHAEGLPEMRDESLSGLGKAVKAVAAAVVKATGATGFNILQNNGADAGQAVFHFHVHIIPRHANDGVFPLPKPRKDTTN